MAKQTEKKRSSRTALVNGELMDLYRAQKGWDDLKLAAKAELSAKTIERARQGKPIMIESLYRIAEALGVLPVKLMPEAAELIRPSPSAAKKPRMLVVFVVDDDSELPDFIAKGSVEQLVLTMKYLNLLKDGMLKEQVFEGSKIVVMEISEDDYKILTMKNQSNELLYYDIVYFGAISENTPLEEQLALKQA